MSPNFAARWFEIDTTYQVMRVLNFLGIIRLKGTQKMRFASPGAAVAAPRAVDASE
jgi:stearoyl-CoA desaturase (delta-9 desaturase)